jgi:signal peptidase I
VTVYDQVLPAAGSVPFRTLRVVHTAATAAALGLTVGLAIALLWSTPFGGRTLIEMSGSMSPALAPGDVVVTRGISPLDARLGDVITFRDPEGSGRLLTHRVREMRISGPRVLFVTRGDANTSAERWSIPASGQLGRVAYRVPLLGYALVWTTDTLGKLVFTVLPVLLAAFLVLRRIWRN